MFGLVGSSKLCSCYDRSGFKGEGNGKTLYNVRVEYEWKPPRCSTCKTFGHKDSECPKSVVRLEPPIVEKDAFVAPKKIARGPVKQANKPLDGFYMNKQKPKVVYRVKVASSSKPVAKPVSTQLGNRFGILDQNSGDPNDDLLANKCDMHDKNKGAVPAAGEISDVEGDLNETAVFLGDPNLPISSEGASTPGLIGPHD